MHAKTRAALFSSIVLVSLLVLATPAYAAKDKYEPDNSLKKAKSVGVSADVASTALQKHNFHSKKDIDYVKLAAKKGRTYVADVLGTGGTNKNRWLKVTVYRYSKTKKKWYVDQAETKTNGDADKYFKFKAVATSTYALRIRPYNSKGSGTSYGVRVISGAHPFKQDAYFAGTDASHPTTLTPKPFDPTRFTNDYLYRYSLYATSQLHSITATPSYEDHDWFNATLSPSVKGGRYYLEIFTGDWSPRTVWETIYFQGWDDFGGPFGSLNLHYIVFPIIVGSTQTYHIAIQASSGTEQYWYRIGLFYPK